MNQILVPCDGSASALRAVRHAASVAQQKRGVRVELLHVLDPMRFSNPSAALPSAELERLAGDEADRILQPAQRILDACGVPYRTHRRVGDPAAEIAVQVVESGCDSVVMGTRGMSAMASLFIGSVACRVVHLVDVPVTLVK